VSRGRPRLNARAGGTGKQHFEPVEWFGGKKGLQDLQKRDNLKRTYCESNNIRLITISYDEDVDEALDRELGSVNYVN